MLTALQGIELKTNDSRVIIIIPAYNEENKIYQTLESIPPEIRNILVIDDGSVDNTRTEIKRSSKNLKLFTHKKNQGKGAAIVTALKYLKIEIGEARISKDSTITFVDADGQMDMNFLNDLVGFIAGKNGDFVKASRFLQPEGTEQMPKFRKIGNVILRYLNRISTGQWQISDPQNGYFAFSAHLLDHVNLDRISKGYYVENSFLINLSLQRIKANEIPIPGIYGNGEISSIKYRNFIPKTSYYLLKDWIQRSYQTKNESLLRFFNFIFLIGTFGLGFLTIAFFLSSNIMMLSMGGSAIIFFLMSLTSDYLDYRSWRNVKDLVNRKSKN
ncbi:MAG: glycosyltransferase family 2 protein [Candidatus Heimdallarchaeota archaeon]|nr:glycosyltransferase family 2 protein [Candidatus Heimdallarchaeota archaeon]